MIDFSLEGIHTYTIRNIYENVKQPIVNDSNAICVGEK